MLRAIYQLLRDERGISTLEYALLLSFIGVAIAAAAALLGQNVNDSLQSTTDTIESSN